MDPTKFIYGTILNQAYGPLTSKLMTIELTIRGDPYWLGAGTFEKAISRANDQWSDVQPNFAVGCNVFILRFAYPLGQDDDGNLLLNNNETVTGCYQVNRVTHHFTDGKFTQVLSATRLPVVDLFSSVFTSAGTGSGTGAASTGASGTNTDGGTTQTTAGATNGVNVPKTTSSTIPGVGTGPSLLNPASTTGGSSLIIPQKMGGTTGSSGTGPIVNTTAPAPFGTSLSGFNLTNTGF